MTNNDELALKLKARYSEPEAPKCRICGAEMSIQRAGGGSIVYGCDGRVDGDGYAFKEGRSFADKHYEQSRETVYNHGDPDVIEMLAERDADKKQLAAMSKAYLNLRRLTDVYLHAYEEAKASVSELQRLREEETMRANRQRHNGFMMATKHMKQHENVHYADAAEVEIAALHERISELEARTVSVKLPEPATEGGRGYRQKVIWVLKEALFDAGINLEVRE